MPWRSRAVATRGALPGQGARREQLRPRLAGADAQHDEDAQAELLTPEFAARFSAESTADVCWISTLPGNFLAIARTNFFEYPALDSTV